MMSPRARHLLRLAGQLAFVVFVATAPLILKYGVARLFPAVAVQFPLIINIMILVAICAIAALGLNIIVGYCGLLNLGFAGFMLIGAYTTAILMKEYAFSFWAAAIVSVTHAALWGIVLGIPTLRLTGDYFAIVTFGFSELMVMFARNWDAVTRGSRGYPGVPRPSINLNWLHSLGVPAHIDLSYVFTIGNRVPYWYLAGAFLCICMLLSDRLAHSRLGRAWRALREDETAAEACGINAMAYKTTAFAISAGLGGLAGALFASYNAFVDVTQFTFMTSVFILCYLVLGGMGTVVGPVAGAAVLVTLGEVLRDSPTKAYIAPLFSWWPSAQKRLIGLPWTPDMRYIMYGIILILMIRFRPEGLFPSRTHLREFRGADSDEEASLFGLKGRPSDL